VVHICDQANAVYIPRLHGKSHVVTCHDMLAIRAAQGEIPESPTGWTGRIFQRWILGSLRRAQYVICVSEQTERELQRITQLPQSRLAVVPNALNYPYRPMPVGEANAHLRALALADGQPFFVHVGGNQWYKNRLGAVRIFAELAPLPRYERHVLVMAGKPWTDELRELVVKLGMRDRVLERVEVSNEQLRALYSSAEALLFPSLAEGFGWPIAEAQACGCPVVTTDKAPMTDVGGDAAIYIDPADPAGAAAAVAKALQQRDAYCRASLANAARFSTHAMIDGYLRSYQVVASN
jgi:glycosyltransferase involved in cell wall biosynthesis